MRPLVAALLVLAGACDPPPTPMVDAGPQSIADGVFAEPGEPVAWATSEQRERFMRGRSQFERVWTRAEGAGPFWNTTSCISCHESPTIGGGAGAYRSFLLVRRELPDGTQELLGANGVLPHYQSAAGAPWRPTPQTANLFARRSPPPILGLGGVTAIPTAVIAANADPNDRDGDGVSGRVNIEFGSLAFHGYKAQSSLLERIVRGQIFEHMGITSNPLTDAERAELPGNEATGRAGGGGGGGGGGDVGRATQAQVRDPDLPTTDIDAIPGAEISGEDLLDLVTFVSLLAVPRPRTPDAAAERGEGVFADAGCATCHVPTLSSSRGLIPLYSDLLLHDMGELGDGMTARLAETAEIRTSPLWYLAPPYLHDGSALTLREAITAHDGEARGSRDRFADLGESEQEDLLAFLSTFEPAARSFPQVGEVGGPAPTAEAGRFADGAAAFSSAWGPAAGLGPTFDADSCASCHQSGAPGGGGPIDTNVFWEAFVDGTAVTPVGERFWLNRQATDGTRPTPPSDSVLFPVQPPPLFGLAALSAIDPASIRALEDPTDSDGDGVSGRAAELSDAVGRFGWKANRVSLEEAVADCARFALGLTVGSEVDSDSVADPELDADRQQRLVDFVSTVAFPTPSGVDEEAADRGEALFLAAPCATCHVEELMSLDGEPLRLYSDFLLHDMGEASASLAIGEATESEYRTPTLRGLAFSAPYLHDGSAATPSEAVSRHAGEADASRLWYEDLSATEQADLDAFLLSR